MMRRLAACMAVLAMVAMPAKAATIFKEAGGKVVIEAEHYTARTLNGSAQFTVVPDETVLGQPGGTPAFINARGSYVVTLPDSPGGGVNHNGAEDAVNTAPFIDYKVNITTVGEYRLWLRWGGYDGSSDSMYGQILELNATSPRWYRFSRSIGANFASADWQGIGGMDSATGGPDATDGPTLWTISTPGTYTIRLTQREDGSATDAIIFQLSSLPDPPAAPDPGPAESDLAEGFVLNSPSDAIALPPNTATFTATAKTAAGATVTYQWQSKAPGGSTFGDIASATSASYTTPPTTLAMSGTQYRVKATSGGTTLTSGAATLTTDNIPPSILHAFSGPASTQVTIQFSEKLDPTSAVAIGNYTINPALTVTAAKLAPDNKTVYLKTSAQTANSAYTVTVNGVKDVPGNVLNNGTATFQGAVQVTGQLLVRRFDGIGGVAVNDLLNSPLYPDQPAEVGYWTAFGGADIFPTVGDNFGSNFGMEITGFVVPTTTADYEFYIASDDASQLWLSTDETAANASLIAQQPGCCNTFTHNPGGLSSLPIHLESGKQYYVRAYLKEGGGGDFISVAWRNSVDNGDITVPPDGNLEGIPAANLATGYDPTPSTINITTQPANLTVKENAPYNFTVGYNAYSPTLGTVATVQWQSAPAGSSTFTDIVGATSTTIGGTFASAAQNGTQFRAVITSGTVTKNSNPATLTVSGSVPLVTLAKTIEQRFFNNVTVNTIAALRSDPRYPNSPTFVTFEPLFEYPPNGGGEAGSTYGNRLAGWLNPPEDGDYVFFVNADDPGELWLSTDQDPINKKLIALEAGWSAARNWNSIGGTPSDTTQKRSDQFTGTQWPVKDVNTGAAIITLQKGKHYYIEALHTEGGGGDNIGVAWKTPSGIEPADLDPPIPADYVDQLFAITGAVTFNTQPANTTAAANTSATFTAAATATDGAQLNYIWQTAPAGSTDFVAVGNGTSYTTPLLNATTDQGRQYRVLAFGPSGAGLSSIATVNVTADNVPPTITYFAGTRSAAQLVFSEGVDPVTGADTANYTLTPGGTVSAATITALPSGASVVTLDLTGLTDLTSYTLTIKNVKDTATPGNPIVQTTKTFTAYDINADFNGPIPPAKGMLTGTAKILTSGSFDGSGLLELTPAAGSSQGTLGVDDVLGGDATKVTAQFKLFIGNGSANAADGFSFNVAGDIDATTVTTGEEGTGSGLTVSLDTYDNANGEIAPTLEIKWGGLIVDQPDGTPASFQVPKTTLVNNQWVDVFIQYVADTTSGNGTLTLVHNNVKYFDNLPIPGGTPITNPKVAIGARTGGEYERAAIDNLIVAYNADIAPPQPPTISITGPVSGATLTAGTAATITVNAAANQGVNKVEFFANGTLLGQSTTAPYSFTVPGAAVQPGFYTLVARITDNAGVAVDSAGVNVIVRPPASANAPKVLFIHSSGGPNSADNAAMNHLFARGFDVYPIGALASADTDAADKALVVISSSVTSGDVADKFVGVAAGVVNWENALQDNFQLTDDTVTGHGTTSGLTQTTIDILPSAVGHPLAAGLPAGPVVVTSAGSDFSWGLPVPSATRIASIDGNTTEFPIYAVDKGGTLLDQSAAAGRRVHFLMTDATFLSLTADGVKLFDAAADWAASRNGTPPIQLSVNVSAANVNITWTGGGTLEWTSAFVGGNTVWTTTNDSDGSYTEPFSTAQMKFFRVKK